MGLRSWTVAIRCSTRLICRLPPRDNRCRTWSPEEASIGAVPVRPGREVRLVGEAGDVTDLDHAWDQHQRQLVQLAHLHGALLTDPAAAIHQHSQHLQQLIEQHGA